jgi:hypothetical protein
MVELLTIGFGRVGDDPPISTALELVTGRYDRATQADSDVGSLIAGCQNHSKSLPFCGGCRNGDYHFQPAPPTETMVTTAPAAMVNRVSKLRTKMHLDSSLTRTLLVS